MNGTIRARVKKGVLVPLEKLDLPEGTEVTVTICKVPGSRDREAFLSAAGSWKGLVDCKKLIRDIYRSRLGPGPPRRRRKRRRTSKSTDR